MQTNLVERPSAEVSAILYLDRRHFNRVFGGQQAELSKDEMRLSVPSLKAKIIKFRPRIVCFVGKGMWLVIESVFRRQICTVNDTFKGILKPPSTSCKCSPEPKPIGKPAVTAFNWGLQPYKFVYPNHSGENGLSIMFPHSYSL